MAIEPANDDTIEVNTINAKTGTEIEFGDDVLADIINEATNASGVSINQILKFTTALIPLLSTVDIGTSTAAEHVRELFTKEITSNGQALNIGTDSAHNITFKKNGSTICTIGTYGISQPVSNSLTATGTTISDALALVAAYNVLTTVASGTGSTLPNVEVGQKVDIVNAGANALALYPHSGSGTLNGGSAGASVSIAAGAKAEAVRDTSTNWIVREITAPAA